MSYQAWRADFSSDASVVGTTFYLQSQPVTVVGIAPPAFFGDRINANPPAFWIPLSAQPLLNPANPLLDQPAICWLYALGRVGPGASVGPLQEKISAILRQWISTQDAYTTIAGSTLAQRLHVVLTPGGAGIQNLQQKTGKGLYLLLAISGLVLLVACANVANLLLARATKRKVETSIRMALGAAQRRLIRQMLTESLLLGCLGGLAGLAVAYSGTRVILALAFPDSPHSAIQATPSLSVIAFVLLVSLLNGMVFGIVPTWITSHGEPAEALRGASRSGSDRVSLPQKSLIVFQAALSVLLLVVAGLLTRSLQNMEHQDLGVQTTNRYVLHLDPAGAGYQPEKLNALYEALERQFSAIPGVQTSGLALYSPLDGGHWGFDVAIPGRPEPRPNQNCESLLNRVTPNFLETLGQTIIRGRGFTANDTANSQSVAVVNRAFVKKFFPNEDPIGRHFGSYDKEDIGAYEIVGIVADAKYTAPRDEAQPMYFRPLSQWQYELKDPVSVAIEAQSHYITAIMMQFRGQPQNLDASVRRALGNVDPNLTIIDLHSFDHQVTGNFNQERLIARLATLFGFLTLLLASVGLYGSTSYQVTRRTNEIGLRMALGANRNRVVALVMRGAFTQVALGLALGIPIALIAAHYIADQLYAVKSYDPLSLAVAILVLSAATALAGFIPARRAASIDPIRVLRNQ
jgi:predicted permease